ncbi:helix-turn-helix domain-containing protein [Burkholderia vietnamiensis]|uniref:helix-turn-helix domain-containing protein n=1 Tax=Burkholderia vietnamiensis TaxID=60552 RepID=UPI001CF466EC|nr:helix-turn-helix transcriptional regulator [Burkholderia vietnamiensis]MCA8395546.1 helix-turn-helix domain-containing protein [Burkholderia vietnamiensis]HDR8961602.1 helix-turn-helix transcriptional regulator [Burkholderia vietnamiensis]HDR9247695.1 helix-turn-helix transcriptional regulator [Burkholderia vietnamiensis]
MLHKALRHLRRYHQMTQEQLAKRLEISNNYLSEIESGKKAHALTIDLLQRYAEVFDVPVSSLLLFSEQLDSNRRSEKIRVAIAAKVLKVMDWIDADEKSVT